MKSAPAVTVVSVPFQMLLDSKRRAKEQRGLRPNAGAIFPSWFAISRALRERSLGDATRRGRRTTHTPPARSRGYEICAA